MSNKISLNLKKNFKNNKWKHNVSLTAYHEKFTKKLEDVLVDKKPKYFDEYEVEVLPKPSADIQSKDSENILN